jgi:hypothetical protein
MLPSVIGSPGGLLDLEVFLVCVSLRIALNALPAARQKPIQSTDLFARRTHARCFNYLKLHRSKRFENLFIRDRSLEHELTK